MGFKRSLPAILLLAIVFFSVSLAKGDDNVPSSKAEPEPEPADATAEPAEAEHAEAEAPPKPKWANKRMNPNLYPPYHLTSMKVGLYIVPVLRYDYEMLEPYINERTMEVHIEGHHESYRLKMMETLKEWRKQEPENELAQDSILEIVRNLEKVPEKYRTSMTNNGGGFVNHCFVWGVMAPHEFIKERQPTAGLMKEIEKEFGSYEKFKEEFTEKAKTLFGSGYVWLSRKPAKDGSGLVMQTTSNQDSPISQGRFPILVIDVWEHAYYLQHQHRRVDYIPKWWEVVDWESVDALDAWWKKLYAAPKEEL